MTYSEDRVVSKHELFCSVPPFKGSLDLRAEIERRKRYFDRLVVVIDDDPTGIQTVHDVDVYFSWERGALQEAFRKENLVFVHTNSRALTEERVVAVNAELMRNLVAVSRSTGRAFAAVSRSDSTLRGHFPLETSVLKEVYEGETGSEIDGEILIPFFEEGGRFTCNDIHYVLEGGDLVPAAKTEYARDPVFGYGHSNLGSYVEEKTRGEHPAAACRSIPIEMIRGERIGEMKETLLGVRGFQKLFVNALCYDDLRVFLLALLEAEREGRRFIFRTAASFVKVYGFVDDRGLLTRDEVFGSPPGNAAPGRAAAEGAAGAHTPGLRRAHVLTVVGSYVKKTTAQLDRLLQCPGVSGVQLDVDEVLKGTACKVREIERKADMAEAAAAGGEHPVLYTTRAPAFTDGKDRRRNEKICGEVSDALVAVVRRLETRPSCMIVKGGITSSDVAVKGLGARKARALGQVLPGVPVIRTEAECKWPDIPYVIFPGNVGDDHALRRVYEMLIDPSWIEC
jgi:uncharacterized protein YgbK (DUF1537 family)